MIKIRGRIRVLAVLVLLMLMKVGLYAQQPTHYPGEHEPIQPTLVNLLIFVGGPILLFVIYYYYRKRQKAKSRERDER